MDEAAEQGQTERVAALEARLDALTGLVERQADELQRLRSSGSSAETGSDQPEIRSASAPAEAAGAPGIGRRRLLLGGATAAVATAAAVVAGTEPAAAADDDALLLGTTNTASTRTELTVDGDSAALVLRNAGSSGGALYAESNDPLMSAVGVDGKTGIGIEARSSTKPAISATTSGINTPAVLGAAAQGIQANGVEGVSGIGQGVIGRSTSGKGVLGTSSTDIGVAAGSTSGSGLAAQSVTGPAIKAASGFAHLALVPGGRSAPTADAVAHEKGELVADAAGNLWVCVGEGAPGTWRKAAGPTTAGSFHVLPTPARVYDSRPATAPASVGPKSAWTANTVRTFDLKANGSGVPAGATAALVTLLLVNAANVNGNLTIWAAGAPRPTANSMVWGGSAGRFTALAVTALDAQARVRVHSSAKTDLVLDVVGYYR